MSNVPAIIVWMQNSDIGTGIRESIWLFPIVEATHVLALAFSVGVLVWFDLRLMGWGMKHQPISQVHKQIMPLAFCGFVVMALEMGKPIRQGLAEVEKCAGNCDFYAEHGESFLVDEKLKFDGARIQYHPLGTVLAVMPECSHRER